MCPHKDRTSPNSGVVFPVSESLCELCGSLCLCGELISATDHHRDTENHRACTEKCELGHHRTVELEMPLFESVCKSKQNSPWWLDEGTEVCPACSHAYVIQTEYRCVACDGPMCGLCVETIIETEILCCSCLPAEI